MERWLNIRKPVQLTLAEERRKYYHVMGQNTTLIGAAFVKGKAFVKVNTYSWKAYSKFRTQWNFLNVVSMIHTKPIANIMLMMQYWKLTPEFGNETKITANTTFIQLSDGNCAIVGPEKEVKSIHMERKKKNSLFFTDDMIGHLENSK